jgi:hypothetical protein
MALGWVWPVGVESSYIPKIEENIEAKLDYDTAFTTQLSD